MREQRWYDETRRPTCYSGSVRPATVTHPLPIRLLCGAARLHRSATLQRDGKERPPGSKRPPGGQTSGVGVRQGKAQYAGVRKGGAPGHGEPNLERRKERLRPKPVDSDGITRNMHAKRLEFSDHFPSQVHVARGIEGVAAWVREFLSRTHRASEGMRNIRSLMVPLLSQCSSNSV